jgi:hypothetical protein
MKTAPSYIVANGEREQPFNVRVNGKDIAVGVTRAAADRIASPHRGKAFILIYRSHKPLDGRKAAWHKAPWCRPMSMRVTELSRAKALAACHADPDIAVSFDTATHSQATFAVGAL